MCIPYFQEAASAAGTKAGAKAGYEEAMKAAGRIALETAAKAAREKILAMASRRQIKLSATWKPTSLIAIINMRTDLRWVFLTFFVCFTPRFSQIKG